MPSGLLVAIAMLAASAAVSAESGEEGPDALTVFVSIPPQQYVVDQIGGAHVETDVLVPPGQSPHSFDPTLQQMIALSECRLYLAIGLPFERELLERIEGLYPDLAVVDMGEGVPRRPLEGSAGSGIEQGQVVPHEDGHGPEADAHEHAGARDVLEGSASNDGADPHIWLSPRLVQIQARNVCNALVELDPTHAEDYRGNLETLLTDLDRLDVEIAEALAPVRGKTVYVFHPAFGYLADAYGLKQAAVETGGSEPSARELARLIERAKEDGVRVIFVQPQFATKSAAAVAREIGGAVVPLDPLAYDYLTNLRTVASRIREALEEGGG